MIAAAGVVVPTAPALLRRSCRRYFGTLETVRLDALDQH